MIALTVNGKRHDVDVSADMPLLWVIRDNLGLTGTKFGCGLAQCGACTVHLDGEAVRSCVTPASSAAGKKVTTIEGLSPDHEPCAAAGLDCRAGAAVRLLPVRPADVGRGAAGQDSPTPTDAQIDTAMTGNICRCGTYQRIRRAIHRAARA